MKEEMERLYEPEGLGDAKEARSSRILKPMRLWQLSQNLHRLQPDEVPVERVSGPNL